MSADHLRTLGAQLEHMMHEVYMLNQALLQKAVELDQREERLTEMENRLFAERGWALPSTPPLDDPESDSFSYSL